VPDHSNRHAQLAAFARLSARLRGPTPLFESEDDRDDCETRAEPYKARPAIYPSASATDSVVTYRRCQLTGQASLTPWLAMAFVIDR